MKSTGSMVNGDCIGELYRRLELVVWSLRRFVRWIETASFQDVLNGCLILSTSWGTRQKDLVAGWVFIGYKAEGGWIDWGRIRAEMDMEEWHGVGWVGNLVSGCCRADGGEGWGAREGNDNINVAAWEWRLIYLTYCNIILDLFFIIFNYLNIKSMEFAFAWRERLVVMWEAHGDWRTPQRGSSSSYNASRRQQLILSWFNWWRISAHTGKCKAAQTFVKC